MEAFNWFAGLGSSTGASFMDSMGQAGAMQAPSLLDSIMGGAGSMLKNDQFYKGLDVLGKGFGAYSQFRLGKKQEESIDQARRFQLQDYQRQRGYEEENKRLRFS